jgi:hypothetical protein
MANDRYQFMQGKRYACDMLETLRNLANDPKFAIPVVERLEQSCANKPPSFTAGVLLITRNVRRFFGGMKTNFKGGV